MKKFVPSLLLTALVSVPAAVMAADSPHSVTGNLSLTNDYRFRGISQTYKDPAIQGGFDYAHSSGFYLGTWASNVESISLNGANMEWDFYGGYSTNLTDDLNLNVGGLYYYYPSQTGGAAIDIDTFEVYAGVTWKWLNLKYSHTTTKLFGIANSKGSGYLEGNVSIPLGSDFTLGLHYAHQGVDGAGNDDYNDWKISISKPFAGFNFTLAYVDTDVKATNVTWGGNTAVAKGTDTEDLTDGTLLLTVGKTF